MAFTKKQREKIHSKYGGNCAYCGCEITVKEMQIDHIIPKRRFKEGDKSVDDEVNLNPACGVCNNWKTGNGLETFRNELSEQINRLNSYSSNFRIAKRYGLVQEIQKPIVFYFENF